jgi:hypothetical protein
MKVLLYFQFLLNLKLEILKTFVYSKKLFHIRFPTREYPEQLSPGFPDSPPIAQNYKTFLDLSN